MRNPSVLPLVALRVLADTECMAPYLLIGFLILLAVLAPLFGTDTGDGRDWWPRQRRIHTP